MLRWQHEYPRRPGEAPRRHVVLGVATLAVLSTASGLPVQRVLAQQAAVAVALTAEGGIARAGEWAPVFLTLQNSAADFTGSIQIDGPSPPSPGVPNAAPAGDPGSRTSFQFGVSVGANSTSHVTAHIIRPRTTGSVDLQVRLTDADGTGVATARARIPQPASGAIVAIVSDGPTTLDRLHDVAVAPDPIQVNHLRPEQIPESALLLRGFDVVMVDDANTGSLTAAQRGALEDYVAQGGSLLVAGGHSWRKTVSGIPRSLLPVEVLDDSGMEALPTLSAMLEVARLPAPADIARSRRLGGASILAEGATPLLVVAAAGHGVTAFAAMDLNAEPFVSWAGTPVLLRQIMSRLVPPTPSAQPASGTGPAGPAPPADPIAGALNNLPAVDMRALPLGWWLVTCYVLMSGGVLLLLRRTRRAGLPWLLIPVTVAAASAIAYGLWARGETGAPAANRITITHLPPGLGHAYVQAYTALLARSGGDYRLPAESAFVSAMAGSLLDAAVTGLPSSAGAIPTDATDPADPANQVSGAMEVRGAGPAEVSLVGVQPYRMRSFLSEAFAAPPGALAARLEGRGERITGAVTSHLNSDLSGAAIAAGDTAVFMGDLRPGQTMGVDLHTATSPSGGLPAGVGPPAGAGPPAGLGPPGGFGPAPTTPNPAASAAPPSCAGESGVPCDPWIARLVWGAADEPRATDPELVRRYRILQTVFAAGHPDPHSPVLVGWSQTGTGVATVNHASAPSHDMQLIVAPESVGLPRSPSHLYPGDVPAHLLDTSVDAAKGTGRATYDFELPGLGWHAITVNMDDSLYPDSQLLAFDQNARAWVPLASTPGASGLTVTTEPAARFVSHDGVLLVRVAYPGAPDVGPPDTLTLTADADVGS